MILKASQRAGGSQLARHLLNANDNDHITIHEVSGFMADDVHGAFREVEAISKGTKCKQYLFSLSLSPPPSAEVTRSEYEEVIARVEETMKLTDQPRVIVFHEKENRIHAHAVWSRIDADTMTAINLPFFKRKLMEVSRDIYLAKDWPLPSGFLDQEKRDPLNYSLEEYSQAKRLDRNPKLLKAALKACWDRSETKTEFQSQLKAHGFFLARGDRRGYVAVNMTGEILSLSRWLGVKSRALKVKFGDKDALPTVSEVSMQIQSNAQSRIEQFKASLRNEKHARMSPLLQKRREIIKEQSRVRKAQATAQAKRTGQENEQRQARFRKGLKGLWDRLSGRHRQVIARNKEEFIKHQKRDEQERHTLRIEQLRQRRQIISRINAVRGEFEAQAQKIHRLLEKDSKHASRAQLSLSRKKAPSLDREQ